jgi:hypothetical protein
MTFTVGIATTGDSPAVLRETVVRVIRSAELVSAGAEVLVVVNGRGRVPELDGVDSPLLRVRYLDKRGIGLARNTVLDEARHDTILFTDDDCYVPPSWCAELVSALHEPGWAAVGAPVRIPVAGPVSAYLDYLRIYDAVPFGSDGPLLLVTANCGLRRDLIPRTVRFDACLTSAGAEDTAFGLELGRHGLRSRWLAGATPIEHGCSEELEEITERYLRYARNGPHLFLEHGMGELAMPGILSHYRQRLADDNPFDRRFGEFLAPEARTAFATYDCMAAGAIMIGYLHRLGTELEHPLVELDLDGLRAAWTGAGQRLAEATSALSPSDWASLDLDYATMAGRLDDPQPLPALVRRALRRHAVPLATDPTGRVGDVLNHGATTMSDDSMTMITQMRAAFAEMVGRGGATRDTLDAVARAHGLPFKVASDTIEFNLRFDVDGLMRAWRARRQAGLDRVRAERADSERVDSERTAGLAA